MTTDRTAQIALTVDERARLLAGVGLFSGASDAGRAAIAARLVVRDGEFIARLGSGEFFGELSLLDRRPRVASVTADEPTTCLALASWDFEQLLESEPGVALAVLKEVAGRLRAVTVDHRP